MATQEMVTDETQEMQAFKFGRENVKAMMLDRETVQVMADKHGKLVYVDHLRGRYFALPGLLEDDEDTWFCVGGWYIERDGREPGWMTDEEFQAAKG